MQKQMGEWMTTHSKGETKGRSEGRPVIGSLTDRDAKSFSCRHKEYGMVVSHIRDVTYLVDVKSCRI